MEKQLAIIEELRQKVLDSGYHITQLRDIMREVIDDPDFTTITFEESCELIDTLQYYYDFAAKCKKINCHD
ncbi:hypothetical protein [Pelosinus sp. sgz500959]|uniref:hypothetical protein n=1 Tax=Pelosinus sp. sgz500959 TaxID=3242472 RepID=UPI00366CEEBC